MSVQQPLRLTVLARPITATDLVRVVRMIVPSGDILHLLVGSAVLADPLTRRMIRVVDVAMSMTAVAFTGVRPAYTGTVPDALGLEQFGSIGLGRVAEAHGQSVLSLTAMSS